MASSPILEAAHQYAARGWPVLPLWGIKDGICRCSKGEQCESPGKHPCIKTGKAFAAASCDPAQIERWFGGRRGFVRNVGAKTGDDLVLVDIDGAKGMATLAPLVETHGQLDATLMAESGRADGGRHAFYSVAGASPTNSGDGLDIRGDKGLVVLPPSLHASGKRYRWLNAEPIAPMQVWLLDWFWNRDGGAGRQEAKRNESALPEHLRGSVLPRLADRAADGMEELPTPEDLAATVALIPNPDLGWDAWNIMMLAIWAASGGAEYGLHIAADFSEKSEKKYSEEETAKRWEHITKHPPDGIGFGTLVFKAREVDPDFELPSRRPKQEESKNESNASPQDKTGTADAADQTETNGVHFPFEEDSDPKALIALNDLNKRYSVIGDIGGKCLVLSWVPSRVDDGVKIASFQSFKSFSEYYGNRYIKIRKEKGDGEITEKSEPLGPYWLKWRRRLTYQGLDLVPGAERVLPDGTLNLWRGYAVEPRAGTWRLMQRHIVEVLASGDRASAEYIFRFAAWAVQHPGERAEVALVFKGDKGSGKGTFANALKRLFGAHGLQIYSSKHLVGAFNGHLRSCLLLFADEAFWAGDKQGESVLKGMLTESTLMIEQKGVDAVAWKNRLHVIMAANAEWVVPASHDERRYMVVDVSRDRIGDFDYFKALHAEINAGGLAAMLHDLRALNLKDWHPRNVIQTEALRQQKERSLDPRHEWWESLLQGAVLPGGRDAAGDVPAHAIYRHARETVPRLKEASETALGRFLRVMGCHGIHKKMGNYWHFPTLKEARGIWCSKFSKWDWRNDLEDWHG